MSPSWSSISNFKRIYSCFFRGRLGETKVGLGVRTLLPPQEMKEAQVQSLGREDPLEEGMAAHSSILVWRIPWTEAILHGVAKSQTWLNRLSTHSEKTKAKLRTSGKRR